MLMVAGLLKGRSPVEGSCEGMRSTVVQSMWCIYLWSSTVLFLPFVMSGNEDDDEFPDGGGPDDGDTIDGYNY